MNSATALLLDLDGVLVDTETPALDALVATFSAYGFVLCGADVDARFRGRNLDLCTDSLEEIFAGPVAPMFIRDARAAARARPVAAAEPGARAVLTCGVALRVVTNSTLDQAVRTLERAGLGEFADPEIIVAVDDARRPKPDPDLYIAAIDSLDVSAESCLAVEDSRLGLAAATAAGTRVIGYAPTRAWAQVLCDAGYETVSNLEAVTAMFEFATR